MISLEEMAEVMGCSLDKVKAGLRSGRYPGSKEGRGWVVPREAFFQRLKEIAIEEAAVRRQPKVGRRRQLLSIPKSIGKVAAAQR